MAKRIGTFTVEFESKPKIIGYGAVVGNKEGSGPFGAEFDAILSDPRFGEETFEEAESKLQKAATAFALDKAGIKAKDIDVVCGGDLLNQCIGTSFAQLDYGIPLLGVYGACSTMTLSLAVNAFLIESGGVKNAISVTSSHFCSAERQYRFPLEYGNQRTPTAQWTVTGSGAAVLSNTGNGPYIKSATIGRVVELGITDPNNMGAAMAPAAADTMLRYFDDTKTGPEDYDLIFTGDLGFVGTQCLYELMDREGVDIKGKHTDCGLMIYDREKQDVHSGGSGCGCSASMLCSYVMHRMEEGKLNNILFMSTGALMSPTSSFQGKSIPGIAHLLNIRNDKKQ